MTSTSVISAVWRNAPVCTKLRVVKGEVIRPFLSHLPTTEAAIAFKTATTRLSRRTTRLGEAQISRFACERQRLIRRGSFYWRLHYVSLWRYSGHPCLVRSSGLFRNKFTYVQPGTKMHATRDWGNPTFARQTGADDCQTGIDGTSLAPDSRAEGRSRQSRVP